MGSIAPAVAPLRGDEADLFDRHHQQLLRVVARDVRASPQLIEDGCAFAWLELVARQPDRINPMGWLRVVAGREAVRLATYDRRMHAFGETVADPAVATELRFEVHAGLEALATLPPRQRDALTLRVSGHSHAEIGARLDMTARTVERQLGRARRAVRRAGGSSTAQSGRIAA